MWLECHMNTSRNKRPFWKNLKRHRTFWSFLDFVFISISAYCILTDWFSQIFFQEPSFLKPSEEPTRSGTETSVSSPLTIWARQLKGFLFLNGIKDVWWVTCRRDRATNTRFSTHSLLLRGPWRKGEAIAPGGSVKESVSKFKRSSLFGGFSPPPRLSIISFPVLSCERFH